MLSRKEKNEVLQCNFCGSRTLRKERCAGCGGSSFSRVNKPELTENPNDQAIRQVIETQRNLKVVSLILAFSFIAIALSIVKSKKPEESIATDGDERFIEYTKDEIQQLLAEGISEDYEFLYVVTYSNSSPDNTITLDIKENKKPIVLVLTSYEAVNWKISNPFNADIRAIVYGSDKMGTTVKGDITPSAIHLPHTGPIRGSSSFQNCPINTSTMDTSESDLNKVMMLEELGTGVLGGTSYRNSANQIKVPQTTMGARYVRELKDKYNRCTKRSYSSNTND